MSQVKLSLHFSVVLLGTTQSCHVYLSPFKITLVACHVIQFLCSLSYIFCSISSACQVTYLPCPLPIIRIQSMSLPRSLSIRPRFLMSVACHINCFSGGLLVMSLVDGFIHSPHPSRSCYSKYHDINSIFCSHTLHTCSA